ncbi:MAG: hypothetical protein WBQ86_07440 [Candidatus Binatus sp.]
MDRNHAQAFPLTVVALVATMLLLAASPGRALAGRKSERQLTVCRDTEFALCAASTCSATGGSIEDNQGTKYPAVSCVCPILVGDNVADLNGGNMKGSCTSPDPTMVYSTFEFSDSFPQLIDGTWQDATSIMQICPSQYSFSQCWNWQCVRAGTENGIALAECTCPMEKTSYSFVTQAGQGNSSACADLPVGGPLFFNPGSTHSRSGH